MHSRLEVYAIVRSRFCSSQSANVASSFVVPASQPSLRTGLSARRRLDSMAGSNAATSADWPGRLTFLPIDEKPFWINSAGGKQIWTSRGKHVPVRCEATRDARLERWTGITAVYSRAVVDSRCSLREVASSATIGSGARLGGVIDCEDDEDAIRLSYC